MSFPVDNIRRGCKAKGITLAELERITGIGNGVIARWENAKTAPPIDRIMEIAFVLEMPLDELCGTEKPAAHTGDGSNLERYMSIFNQLSAEDQAKALSYAEFLLKDSGHN